MRLSGEQSQSFPPEPLQESELPPLCLNKLWSQSKGLYHFQQQLNTLYFSDRSTRSSSALLLLPANRWLCSWMIQFSGKTNKAWQIQIIVCRRDKVIMRKCIGGNWSFFQEAVWFTGHANNNFLCVPPLMGGGWSQRWGWKVHAKRTDFIMMQYPEESTEVLWPLIICGGVYWKAVWLPLRITYRDRTMAGSHWVTAEAVN